MEQFLANEKSILFIMLGLMGFAWLIGHVATCWFKYRKVEVEAALKQEMIQRGMCADDIVRVLRAPGAKELWDEATHQRA